MLNKLSINIRMLLLIILPAIVLIVTGYVALTVIGQNTTAMETSKNAAETVTAANKITYNVNKHYTQLLSNINSGFIFWSAGEKRSTNGLKTLRASFHNFNSKLTSDEKITAEIQQVLGQQNRLLNSYESFSKIFAKEEDKKALNTYVLKKMYPLANALTSSMKKIETDLHGASAALTDATLASSKQTINKVLMYVFGGLIFTMILGNLIMLSITRPTRKLTQVVHRLFNGEYEARVKVTGTDEFSRLGDAFNNLLDDRSSSLEKTESEHQELNQSVFKLLQAVANLSEKDLTVRAEVTEDATGPVADAINLLAEETASTLAKVRDVASDVDEASQKVNTHLMTVNKLAMREQQQAIETAEQMDNMIERLDQVANSAAETNSMADDTTESTKLAHQSVTETLNGMSDIRETVQETGKKIKQLGERSQEISHVIDIINTIAERTTVLALNASMQAVAAGDAGRGFSVIAEEIQRLAESSRESTGQISTLVRNIQQETNATITTMDKTIEQVINGTTRAEDAAEQMQKVLETTTQLVDSVDEIAKSSREQVGISENLKHKAQSILKSTQSTGQELLSLTGLSRNMADYAKQLVQSVNIFTIDDKSKKNEEVEV